MARSMSPCRAASWSVRARALAAHYGAERGAAAAPEVPTRTAVAAMTLRFCEPWREAEGAAAEAVAHTVFRPTGL
jgi:hypothetical protein